MTVLSRDRRSGYRVPLELFLNQYVGDRLVRGLTANIGPTGLYLQTARPLRSRLPAAGVVGLEFELPRTGEVIWARGEICYASGDTYAMGSGIRFTGMASLHERLLRDFCIEARHRHLGNLLQGIRTPGAGRKPSRPASAPGPAA
jgi:PilZ domain